MEYKGYEIVDDFQLKDFPGITGFGIIKNDSLFEEILFESVEDAKIYIDEVTK